jgi:hypothetical protein
MTDPEYAAAKRSASTQLNGRSTSIFADVPPRAPRTHEQKVELYLKTIAWFTGIVAAATVASFIAAIALGAAAGAHGIGY